VSGNPIRLYYKLRAISVRADNVLRNVFEKQLTRHDPIESRHQTLNRYCFREIWKTPENSVERNGLTIETYVRRVCCSVTFTRKHKTSLFQKGNLVFSSWEKKKVLLGRQTKQVIIEINVKPGSHVAIDDIKLEDCLPGNA